MPPDMRQLWIAQQAATLHGLGVRRALTLWPEWAWAITDLDKRVENRGWPPFARLIGQRIAIHAGAYIGGRDGRPARAEGWSAVANMATRAGWNVQWADQKFLSFRKNDQFYGVVDPLTRVDIPTSAIVAHAKLASVTPPSRVTDNDGWYVGEYGWRLEDLVVLPEPIPMQGAQSLWEIRG